MCAQPSRKPQRRFQFIGNSDVAATGSNSTQVRRHVMQEYRRQKRWQAPSTVNGSAVSETRKRRKPETDALQPRRKPTHPKDQSFALRGPSDSESGSSSKATLNGIEDEPIGFDEALMTINTAIWENRHSTELSEDFLGI